MAVSEGVHLSGLARKLVMDGLIDESDAQTAFKESLSQNVPFVAHVVAQGLADASKIAHAAADEFGAALMDINSLDLEKDVTRLVDEKLIRKHHVLPIYKRGNRLFVAASDPTNLQAMDEIKFATGSTVESILVEENKLATAIDRALEDAEASMDMGDDDDLDDFEGLEMGEEANANDEISAQEIDDAPVVKFVHKMLLDAIKKGASDIHFEPYEKFCRVRFRTDGVLVEVSKPPLTLARKIAARIKVMSRLDVSERRVPQDGRIKLKLSKNKAIDFRVSTCPTLFGEKAVLRILDSSMSIPLDSLGYEDFQKEIFLKNLYKPYGMFLVTGPTGSGKTVSLYTGIDLLNQPDINISTAEDPVEINLAGVNQVQVDERTGMSFEKALKAFLRQDPDIILVGEIRDLVTGNIAIKAAQTGHMVMSTLHTNDAPQTLTRMVDMGVQPFAIATSVNVITAQRLGRRLCGNCKRRLENVPKEALLKEGFTEEDVESDMVLYEPVGCGQCNSGYKGRVGIYQVMEISEEMKRMVMEGRNAIDIADQAAREGVWDIRTAGINKVKQGMTSIEELNRVTQE